MIAGRLAITFARAVRPAVALAKTIILRDDAIVGVRPSPQASLFAFREVEFAGLEDLMEAVTDAAGRGEIALRGRPLASTGRRAIYDDPEKGPAGLAVEPRTFAAFDWDGMPLEPQQREPAPPEVADDPAESWNWALPDPLLDPEIGVRVALRRLPPAFRKVSCGWQVTGSACFKPGWRLRTWHLLDHLTTGAELKTSLRPAIERKLVDPVTLVEAQPHFLAVTAVGGADPCPQRFGVFKQSRDLVQVPDIAGIARRQDERERAERERRYQRQPYSHKGDQSEAKQRIADCLTEIRGAGARHTTYVPAAARAKAICDRFGLEWKPVRRQLIEVYEFNVIAGRSTRAAPHVDRRRHGLARAEGRLMDRPPDWATEDLDDLDEAYREDAGEAGGGPNGAQDARASGEGKSSKKPTITPIDFSTLPDAEPARRRFLIDQWLPDGCLSSFYGPGGVGKSLAAQQAAACIVTGLDFLGAKVERVPVLGLFSEDDDDELQRRQWRINQAFGLKNQISPAFTSKAAQGWTTASHRSLRAHPEWRPCSRSSSPRREIAAGLVVLDNRAQMLLVNENDRAQATFAANLCAGLGREANGAAVLLLGHVAKSDGSEYSGSTAWDAVTRSRWWLRRADPEIRTRRRSWSSIVPSPTMRHRTPYGSSGRMACCGQRTIAT